MIFFGVGYMELVFEVVCVFNMMEDEVIEIEDFKLDDVLFMFEDVVY